MLSWHNNPALKARVLERMREHQRQDTIVQGSYQRIAPEKAIGYRGCAIGCTLPMSPARVPNVFGPGFYEKPLPPALGWHGEVEHQYGIPRVLGYLIDHVFEALPLGEHAQFAVDVIEAIPVGKDLIPVAVGLLQDLQARHPILTNSMDIEKASLSDSHKLHVWVADLSPAERGRSGKSTYYRWIRDRFLHHLRALEPAPPLIQHIDIPEPEPILIRTVVNN